MTNTAQEFKVGDKFIVTEKSFRDRGYTHVYTVSQVTSFAMIQFRNHDGEDSLVYPGYVEKYIEPEKHTHHDLIVAWAKDPKGVIIQFKNKSDGWVNTGDNTPSWFANAQYRIKPNKTKEVQRWKWVFKVQDGYEVTNGYYTDEEANKHFDKALLKIEDSAVTAIEEI